MDNDERRNFTRMNVELAVRETASGHCLTARAVDLGVLGMRYLAPDGPTPPGREVTLELALPDGGVAVSVRGLIIDDQPATGGRYRSVQFAYLSDEDARRVCRHLGDPRA